VGGMGEVAQRLLSYSRVAALEKRPATGRRARRVACRVFESVQTAECGGGVAASQRDLAAAASSVAERSWLGCPHVLPGRTDGRWMAATNPRCDRGRGDQPPISDRHSHPRRRRDHPPPPPPPHPPSLRRCHSHDRRINCRPSLLSFDVLRRVVCLSGCSYESALAVGVAGGCGAGARDPTRAAAHYRGGRRRRKFCAQTPHPIVTAGSCCRCGFHPARGRGHVAIHRRARHRRRRQKRGRAGAGSSWR
jgi:hypothetical protein